MSRLRRHPRFDDFQAHAWNFKELDFSPFSRAQRPDRAFRGKSRDRLSRIGVRKSGGELGFHGLRHHADRIAARPAYFELVCVDCEIVLVAKDSVEAVSRGSRHFDVQLLLTSGFPQARADSKLQPVAQRYGR